MTTLEARYYMHFTHFTNLVGCLQTVCATNEKKILPQQGYVSYFNMLDILRVSSWALALQVELLLSYLMQTVQFQPTFQSRHIHLELQANHKMNSAKKPKLFLEKVAQCLSQYSRTRGKFSNFYSKFLKLSSAGKKLLGKNTDIFIGPRNLIQFMRQLVPKDCFISTDTTSY